MLTGYNQDVPVGDELIHVQTEDKGREKALIETLVYRGGTIIAAKRTSYAPQLEAGIDDNALAETLKKQHQIIVAIIRAGKVEELVRASQKAAAVASARPAPEPVREIEEPPAPPPPEPVAADASPAEAPVFEAPVEPDISAPPLEVPQIPSFVTEPAASLASPLAEPEPALAAAPPVPAELDAGGRAVVERLTGPLTGELDLDKIISDYLQSGLQKEKLRLRLLGRADFLAGENVFLQVQATRGSGQPIEGASVVVKVIGTAFKPQIYPGRTDHEGVASFQLTLPTFAAGSAAVVVQASSKHGDGEIKHLIRRR